MKTRRKKKVAQGGKNVRRILITKTRRLVKSKSTPEVKKKKKLSIFKHEEKRKNEL